MRKFLLSLFILFFLGSNAHAQSRGKLTNVFASWVTVASTSTVITFPIESRDLTIMNGSTTDVCVNLKGGDIQGNCYTASGSQTMQLDGGQTLTLFDYVTSGVTLRAIGFSTTASPVSVISTY